MNDKLYALITQHQTAPSHEKLTKILSEMERQLASKVDRIEFSQIVSTKANLHETKSVESVSIKDKRFDDLKEQIHKVEQQMLEWQLGQK
jgi:hypothetical protein